ncbi:hypothetical protein ABWU59_29650 [Priestia megaterium]|uniref:hypothetical protein n=1 Tax=Priestia megaterium TaxID=1404 RepID=UPI00339A6CAE
MQLIRNSSFLNTPSILNFDLSPISDGFLKIYVSGELAAQAADRRLFICLNGHNTGYKSFTLMNGDSSAGEWSNYGFYVGRNGWHLDSSFSLEFTLAVASSAQKITGNGLTTFAHGDDRILGYESHGFFTTKEAISNIQVLFDGGVASGQCAIYQIVH